MTQSIIHPVQGQLANTGNQWLAVLEAAAGQNLIDPAGAARLQGRNLVGALPPDAFAEEVRALLSSGPLPGTALAAIAPAFAPGDVIELRALDPETREGASCLSGRLDDPTERAALAAFVRDNVGRRNLYVGINPRRPDLAGTTRPASEPDIVARRAVVLDLDVKDAPSADPDWRRTVEVLAAELKPIQIVDSGNGVHVWLDVEELAGADLSASSATLAAAMARLGADNMADAPRIIRLPFTVNLPTAAKRQRGAVVRLATPLPGHEPKPRVLRAKPRPVAALCAALEGIAHRLALPGRGGQGTAPAESRTGADGGPKTGWPAPSAALLRAAVHAIPNDQGHFDDREAWAALGHAVKGAALTAGCEAEGKDVWLAFCARWNGPSDPSADEAFWNGVRAPHTGWGAVMRTLERVNPAGAAQVKQAAAQAAFANQAAANRAVILGAGLQPARPSDPKTIPPREWLYGKSVIAGFVSVLAAPGGQGKTSLVMAESVAMASGRELLEGDRPIRPLRVWYHSAEDDLTEAERKLAATLKHHKLNHADLDGRLFMTSGRDVRLKLARMGQNGPEAVPGVTDAIVELCQARQVDVIVFDPLATMHELPENDNTAANVLLDLLRELATRTGAAVVVLHHTSKAAAQDMDAAGAGAVRGASAIVDGSRVTRVLVRMTPNEARGFVVTDEQRRGLLRVEGAKQNLAPAATARWVRLAGVPLDNGASYWPDGDWVGVAERWTPTTGQPGRAADLARVQAAIEASPRPFRADHRSPEWIGWTVATIMGLDTGGPSLPPKDRTAAQNHDLGRVKNVVAGWLQSGGLVGRDATDPKDRKPHNCIFVGQPAALADTDSALPPESGTPKGDAE